MVRTMKRIFKIEFFLIRTFRFMAEYPKAITFGSMLLPDRERERASKSSLFAESLADRPYAPTLESLLAILACAARSVSILICVLDMRCASLPRSLLNVRGICRGPTMRRILD